MCTIVMTLSSYFSCLQINIHQIIMNNSRPTTYLLIATSTTYSYAFYRGLILSVIADMLQDKCLSQSKVN